MSEYFLSYARADQASAMRFARDLKAAGVRLWVDQQDIRPSAHWDQTIHAALMACRGIVVILSPSSAASPNVADEISVAINAGKIVIPILIAPCVIPLRLTRVQFIDATHDYDVALNLAIRATGESAPTPPATVAPPFTIAPDAHEAARAALAAYVGPIAAVLVQDTARRAQTLADFYQRLAAAIKSPADRQAFLNRMPTIATAPDSTSAPLSPPTAFDAKTLQSLVKALTLQVGPISTVMVKREAATAEGLEGLRLALANQIADPHGRARFLADTSPSG